MTDRRKLLCDWLTANGVDPNRVPRDSELYIETDDNAQGTLYFEQYDVDAFDRRVLNERGDDCARRHATVPLAVEPPEWWTPYTKPTREQLLRQLDAVSKLHVRNANSGTCEHCSERDYPNYDTPWPCPTIQALGGVAS